MLSSVRRCHTSISDYASELMEVVAHGDILRWIADGQSQGHMSSRVRRAILLQVAGADIQQWLNCEVKIFSFESDDDEDAKMVEVAAEGKVPRDATDDPTTQEMS
jgi:hypothetical protein